MCIRDSFAHSPEHRCAVKSLVQGPGVDRLPHDGFRGEQGILALPTDYSLRHHEDRGAKGFSVRATNASFPAGLHGLRWVVEGGRATPDLSQEFPGPDSYEDDALVIERRGEKPAWVRAGVGSVVSPRFGWVAVAASRFIVAYDLDLGVKLLEAAYDPFSVLGNLWLCVLEALLLVGFPDGCLAVFAPATADNGERCLREVSRRGVSPYACYAVCGNVLALSLIHI